MSCYGTTGSYILYASSLFSFNSLKDLAKSMKWTHIIEQIQILFNSCTSGYINLGTNTCLCVATKSSVDSDAGKAIVPYKVMILYIMPAYMLT